MITAPKFKNLDNPIVFKTVGRFARISDIAKTSGENLEELLEFLNTHAGQQA